MSWVSGLIDCSLDISGETLFNTIKWEVGGVYGCVRFLSNVEMIECTYTCWSCVHFDQWMGAEMSIVNSDKCSLLLIGEVEIKEVDKSKEGKFN